MCVYWCADSYVRELEDMSDGSEDIYRASLVVAGESKG